MNSSDAAPRVSVIVPVYNSEQYLARCLDSILNQSYDNVEIVAIDDGSQDGSGQILDAFASKYSGKLLVEHRPNAGAAAARNRGIDLARGEYLTFVDNDDWLDQDCLKVLVEAIVKSNADIVCSGYRRPYVDGEVQLEVVPCASDEWGRYVVAAAWAKLYRTEYVKDGGFRFLNTNIDEDLFFSLPALEQAEKVEVVAYCGYNWFNNESSVSNTSQRSSEGLQFEETMSAILKELKERQLSVTDQVKHYFVRLVAWFLLYTCKADGPNLSVRNLNYYIEWLDRSIPDWRQDPFARIGHPTGDAKLNQLAVWLFVKHPSVFSLALRAYRKVG